MARYVRMRKLASEKTSWTVIRSFQINPVSPDAFCTDENPFTFTPTGGLMSLDVPSGASACHLLMKDLAGAEIYVRQMLPDGTYVAEYPVSTSYFEFEIKGNAAKVEIVGNADVFEAVFVE